MSLDPQALLGKKKMRCCAGTAILEKRLAKRADLAGGVHLPLVTETQD